MNDHLDAARLMASQCLCFRARRLARTLTRLYDDALRPLGIQASQMMLLNAVALMGRGGVPMRELADVLAMDATTLSRNVKPLERSGLLRIERSAGDARVRLILLTSEGRKVLSRALPRWTKVHERIVASLGDKEAFELRDRFDAAFAATQDGNRDV